jgi:hypothetical protein
MANETSCLSSVWARTRASWAKPAAIRMPSAACTFRILKR